LKRVLFDANVLLDVLAAREPHYAASVAALDLVGQEKIEGLVSAHAVTTLAYLLGKHVGPARSRELLSTLLSKMRVAAVTDSIIRRALTSEMDDFEDAVCDAAACEAGVSVIVTRNVRDFASATTLAVLPEALQLD
jgi:predicted nucleic acid-binding protein